jgi:hypothetical protein
MNKNIKLPKEGLVTPEDGPDGLISETDVEGHGLPLTPPPSFGANRSPGHGGEAVPTEDDDVEGH